MKYERLFSSSILELPETRYRTKEIKVVFGPTQGVQEVLRVYTENGLWVIRSIKRHRNFETANTTALSEYSKILRKYRASIVLLKNLDTELRQVDWKGETLFSKSCVGGVHHG